MTNNMSEVAPQNFRVARGVSQMLKEIAMRAVLHGEGDAAVWQPEAERTNANHPVQTEIKATFTYH